VASADLHLEVFAHDAESQRAIPALLRTGSEQPFDLADAPLARAELHAFADNRNLLIVWLHHAISDLASSQVLSAEIGRLWTGDNLPPQALQMSDVAVRERAVVPTEEQWQYSADNVLGVPFPEGAQNVTLRPALPDGFRQRMGVTPTQYLRGVRLGRVRADLLASQPADPTTVAETAHRWGFAHLGRFAQYYRQRYGESPSDTLRGR
jgi:hypothetical protein